MSTQPSDEVTAKRRRDLAHRILLMMLAALLLVISIWCVTLLLRSLALRQDLDQRHAWIDDLRRARQELERPVTELTNRGRWPLFDSLRRASDEILEGEALKDRSLKGRDSPPLEQAVRRLQSSLAQLQQDLASAGSDVNSGTAVGIKGSDVSSDGGSSADSDLDPDSRGDVDSTDGANDSRSVREGQVDLASEDDRIWDAAFAVLKASSALEEQIQAQIAGIYRRLDTLWSSLNGLVVVCLLLCASNLGLLQLAHRRRHQLERTRDRAMELASQDSLTELWNREAILRMLRRELARAKRSQTPMGIVLADLDDFRRTNSLVGQEQGDVILREVADRLGALLRPYDLLGRFGGDSFLVLLPTCDQVASRSVAERLRHAINHQEVEYGLGRIAVSISQAVGIVQTPDTVDADLIIHRLQEALTDAQDLSDEPATIVMLGALVSAAGAS